MKRYQVYLNQNSVAILDDFERYTNISRSRLIRAAIDRLAENLTRVFVAKDISPKDKYVFDSLIGCLSFKNRKKTNLASQVDDLYFQD